MKKNITFLFSRPILVVLGLSKRPAVLYGWAGCIKYHCGYDSIRVPHYLPMHHKWIKTVIKFVNLNYLKRFIKCFSR